jgi:hypothetical protein
MARRQCPKPGCSGYEDPTTIACPYVPRAKVYLVPPGQLVTNGPSVCPLMDDLAMIVEPEEA